MHPAVWGPNAWGALHAISFAYSTNPSSKERDAMHRFLHSFAKVLPCKRCSEHFVTHVRRTLTAKTLDNRDALATWAWEAHRNVNERLGKTTPSLEAVAREYGVTLGTRPQSTAKPPIAIICVALAVAIVLLLIVKTNKRARKYA